ncbi:MAG: NADPH-dependent F420 reductase [Chloroflexota bacterium]
MGDSPILMTIAVLGGTGKEGKGLVYRWAKAGYRVLVGSRSPEKAQAAAAELTDLLQGKAVIEGLGNPEAARQANVVVLAVPYAAHRTTLESVREAIQGKLLVDVTVPLVPPKVMKAQMPPASSAAQEARLILGEGVEVCTAFQNISYEHLMDDTEVLDCDVLVTGTSKEARSETLKLVEAAGLTGWDAGPLENSMVVEGLTSVLIYINKQYNSTHAGLKISGVNRM